MCNHHFHAKKNLNYLVLNLNNLVHQSFYNVSTNYLNLTVANQNLFGFLVCHGQEKAICFLTIDLPHNETHDL